MNPFNTVTRPITTEATEASSPRMRSLSEKPESSSSTAKAAETSPTGLGRSMDVIVHITTPDSGKSDSNKVLMGLTRSSARDPTTRKDFYILSRKFQEAWKNDHETGTDDFVLLGPSKELEDEVCSRLDEQLRAAQYDPDKCMINVFFNPDADEELRRQQGMGFMTSTNKVDTVDERDKFVDLAIKAYRPGRLIDSGYIAAHVGPWSWTLHNQAQVEGVAQSVFNLVEETYMVRDMVDTVSADATEGSSLRENLRTHMEATVRQLYKERGWEYDQSLVEYDLTLLPDEPYVPDDSWDKLDYLKVCKIDYYKGDTVLRESLRPGYYEASRPKQKNPTKHNSHWNFWWPKRTEGTAATHATSKEKNVTAKSVSGQNQEPALSEKAS